MGNCCLSGKYIDNPAINYLNQTQRNIRIGEKNIQIDNSCFNDLLPHDNISESLTFNYPIELKFPSINNEKALGLLSMFDIDRNIEITFQNIKEVALLGTVFLKFHMQIQLFIQDYYSNNPQDEQSVTYHQIKEAEALMANPEIDVFILNKENTYLTLIEIKIPNTEEAIQNISQPENRRVNQCVLNHKNILSKAYCAKCKLYVCIDCHIFLFKGKEEHNQAISQMLSSLVKTFPARKNSKLPGFYLYTDILGEMKDSELIIDPQCLSIEVKSEYLMKVLKLSNEDDNVEYTVKQILPKKGENSSSIIEKAKEKYERMKTSSECCVEVYSSKSNESAFEVLMESWGIPCNRINFLKLNQGQILQVFRETARKACKLNGKGIFHGDIKMNNTILNEISYIPKFIDFGLSLKTKEIIEEKIANEENKSELEAMKESTFLYAPNELLQYNSQNEKGREIEYCLSKMDVFYIGMIFFQMITNNKYEHRMRELQELRSSKQTEGKFTERIREILEKNLQNMTWEKEFSLKLIEVIKNCLQTNLYLRSSTFTLFGALKYFLHLSLQEIKRLFLKTEIHYKLIVTDLIETYFLASKLDSEGNSFEERLGLCQNLEILLQKVFKDKYELTPEFSQLCYNKGRVYFDKGEYKTSGKWLKRGINIALKIQVPHHPQIIELLNVLGAVQQQKGKYPKAEELHLRVLELSKEEHKGKNHSRVALRYITLGELYRSMGGQYEKSERFFTQGLHLLKQIYGNNPNYYVAVGYNNFGLLLQEREHFQRAENMHSEGLRQLIQLYGDEPRSELALFYNNIGAINKKLGNLPRAEEMFNKALNLQLKLFGGQPHPSIAITYDNLGTIYRKQGDYMKAEEIQDKALEQLLQIYEDNPHPDIAICYHNQGEIYKHQRKYKKAEKVYKKALNQDIQIFKEKTHPSIISSYTHLGELYQQQKDFQRAEEMFTVTLNLEQERFKGKQHEEIAEKYATFGMLYLDKRDFTRAIQYLNQAKDMIYDIFEQNELNPKCIQYSRLLDNVEGIYKDHLIVKKGIQLFIDFQSSFASVGEQDPVTKAKMKEYIDYISTITEKQREVILKIAATINNKNEIMGISAENMDKPIDIEAYMDMDEQSEDENIMKYVTLVVGGYKLNMELEKLTNLAPIFKKSIESGYDCIELIYLNPDISFNDILKPFLEGNLIINEANLYESIILGIYFLGIKDKYESYIIQNLEALDNLFIKNESNEEKFTTLFNNENQMKNNCILMEINKGETISINKDIFMKRTSLFLWESLELQEFNNELFYALKSKELSAFDYQLKKYCNLEATDPLNLISCYKNIANYFQGKAINLNHQNRAFLLSFAYLYKLKELFTICTNDLSDLPEIDLESTKEIFDFIATKKEIIADCILNHKQPISTIYCNKCKKEICIDCHLFFYLKDEGHAEAFDEINRLLVATKPKRDQINHSGYYQYTKIFNKLNKTDVIINPGLIYAHNKDKYLLKISNIRRDDGEFILTQIIPIKEKVYESKILDTAEQIFELPPILSNICPKSYYSKINKHSYETVMEHWGKSLDKLNYTKLFKEEKLFLHMLREYSEGLNRLHRAGIYHGKLNMKNVIINEQCYGVKFLNIGFSCADQEKILLDRVFGEFEEIKEEGFDIYQVNRLFAANELLQYLNKDGENNVNYSYSKLDVFSFGMTLFIALTNCKSSKLMHLQELRSSVNSEQQFHKEIESILNEALLKLPWNNDFTKKISEIIMVCLQIKYELRPTALQLFALFQYFDYLSVNDLHELLTSFNTSQKILDLIKSNTLIYEIETFINNPACEQEDYIRCRELCEKYKELLSKIYEEKTKNVIEYIYLCYYNAHILQKLMKIEDSWEWAGDRLSYLFDSFPPLHPFIGKYFLLTGTILSYLGSTTEAKNLIFAALAECVKLHKDDIHVDRAIIYNTLSNYFLLQRDTAESEESLKKALSVLIKIFGKNPCLEKALTFDNLADIYKNKKEIKRAEEMYKKALDQRLQIFGNKSHQEKAGSYRKLGDLYNEQNDYKKAEEMYLNSLKQRLDVLGNKQNINLANNYNILGNVYRDQGYLEKAEEMFLIGLSIELKIFGEKSHPEVAACYNSIGTVYTKQGNYRKAEEMFTKSLIQRKEIYGNKEHPELAKMYINLGGICLAQGRKVKSEEMFREALSQYLAIYKNKLAHPFISYCYENLGTLYQEQGFKAQAIHCFKECLTIALSLNQGNKSHPKVVESEENLKNAEKMKIKKKKAVELFEDFMILLFRFGSLNEKAKAKLYEFTELMLGINEEKKESLFEKVIGIVFSTCKILSFQDQRKHIWLEI